MTILTASITSAITAFLIGRVYLNLQYHKSNAGFRQQAIIDCTQELVQEYKANGQIDPHLHIKHRYGLSAVVETCLMHYGLSAADNKEEGVFPYFHAPVAESEMAFFEERIRPVMIDLNNNAFIGWINWVPNVQRLTTLWSICFSLEKVTQSLTYLSEKEGRTAVQNEDKKYRLSHSALASKEGIELKQQHEQIRQLWYKWLQLNKIA
ncbi:hypothetical protein AB9P05_02880 [Roseivirga sp. BDSF3-8]|uniref:hypothetical protein n=1 Tax=Roseivirga sp. BDSF3-8 TaxID=3241598 RepID=UPI0035317FCC